MMIISQELAKHPSVKHRVQNGWQLSEAFCLRYTPQIGICTRVPGKQGQQIRQTKDAKSTSALPRNAKSPSMVSRMANEERY